MGDPSTGRSRHGRTITTSSHLTPLPRSRSLLGDCRHRLAVNRRRSGYAHVAGRCAGAGSAASTSVSEGEGWVPVGRCPGLAPAPTKASAGSECEPLRPRAHRASGATIVVIGLFAAATAGRVLRTGGTPGASCPSTPADQLVVRGSVEQIYVVHAGARKQVTVDGARRWPARTTDASGGLVVRDVPVGRYSVSVEGDRSSPHEVTVVGPDEPPPSDFYSSQTIDIDHLGENPVDGYITTRDCNPSRPTSWRYRANGRLMAGTTL